MSRQWRPQTGKLWCFSEALSLARDHVRAMNKYIDSSLEPIAISSCQDGAFEENGGQAGTDGDLRDGTPTKLA